MSDETELTTVSTVPGESASEFPTEPEASQTIYTTTFGNTVVLSVIPLDEFDGNMPDAPSCVFHSSDDNYASASKVYKVIIVDELTPKSTSGWFKGLRMLGSIEGLEKINMENVTDRSAHCGSDHGG